MEGTIEETKWGQCRSKNGKGVVINLDEGIADAGENQRKRNEEKKTIEMGMGYDL